MSCRQGPSGTDSAAPVYRVHCDYTEDGAPRRLRQLAKQGALVDHLHGVLMKLIAQRLDDEELAEVRAVFEALDADAKGFLSADDLRDALSEKMSTLRVGDRYNATALRLRLMSRAAGATHREEELCEGDIRGSFAGA